MTDPRLDGDPLVELVELNRALLAEVAELRAVLSARSSPEGAPRTYRGRPLDMSPEAVERRAKDAARQLRCQHRKRRVGGPPPALGTAAPSSTRSPDASSSSSSSTRSPEAAPPSVIGVIESRESRPALSSLPSPARLARVEVQEKKKQNYESKAPCAAPRRFRVDPVHLKRLYSAIDSRARSAGLVYPQPAPWPERKAAVELVAELGLANALRVVERLSHERRFGDDWQRANRPLTLAYARAHAVELLQRITATSPPPRPRPPLDVGGDQVAAELAADELERIEQRKRELVERAAAAAAPPRQPSLAERRTAACTVAETLERINLIKHLSRKGGPS